MPSTWRRTTRRRPCPVCRKAGCAVAGPSDRPAAAVCRNVESDDPIDGVAFLHVLRSDGPCWPRWRSAGELKKAARLIAHEKAPTRAAAGAVS